ncbi:hypothetical protein HS041_00015 [Planomonospora sp. ID67723]|uniref:hypothetical protein n=1 Tax=Planomonospora sp. ID67723 TaxID=2738134 RepID=UPI0018C3A99E|nr:hypothetical protein [Planomonospora sp. ID67723]MBG0826169.1 hypothetical protein [Planomonospora sp. ID67723]
MTQTAADSPAPARRQRAQIKERTLRTDQWWRYPLVTFIIFTAFLVYATWAIFDNSFFAAPYHAPFASPCLAEAVCPEDARLFGWAPLGDWYTWPPGLLILGLPAGFRFTCYYYRKAYYRGFWLSPPACAVNEPHSKYTGESRFPLILQNIHRYFFYAAIVIGLILAYDAVKALIEKPGGIGTWVLIGNAILINLYTLSCHSCRHITAGRLNHFSKHPVRYRAWGFVSKLNAKHQELALISMFSVMGADLYVRLVAKGILTFTFA